MRSVELINSITHDVKTLLQAMIRQNTNSDIKQKLERQANR